MYVYLLLQFEFLYLLQFWILFVQHNLVLNAHPLNLHKAFFHSSCECLFILFFFRPEIFHIDQYFFSSSRHQSQGQKANTVYIIYMKRIIWFSICCKIFATRPRTVNLLLQIWASSLFIAVIHFLRLSVVCWFFMRSCLWKLELCFLTNGLMRSLLPKALGPNCPKLVFRPQTPNFRVVGSENFFISSSIKFCIK